MLNRRHAALAFGALAAGLAAPALRAQDARALRIVIPFAAGGSSDAMARVLATRLSAELNRSVIVDPTPGGSGLLAARKLLNALGDPQESYAVGEVVQAIEAGGIVHRVPWCWPKSSRSWSPGGVAVEIGRTGTFRARKMSVHSSRRRAKARWKAAGKPASSGIATHPLPVSASMPGRPMRLNRSARGARMMFITSAVTGGRNTTDPIDSTKGSARNRTQLLTRRFIRRL